MLDSNGNFTKKEDTPTLLPKAVRSNLADAQEVSSETSIAQDAAESKENIAAVQKTVRFALGAPVEVDGQKELVAVHNLTEQNLREALQLGGMPSPSIAVVKAREGHRPYGPVSLVFGSDTIDPMVDKANRVYGADAWTPTRPGVELTTTYDARLTHRFGRKGTAEECLPAGLFFQPRCSVWSIGRGKIDAHPDAHFERNERKTRVIKALSV